jgi:hypothetical protein
MIKAAWSWLTKSEGSSPVSRLTVEEVISIAQSIAAGQAGSELLSATLVNVVDGKLTWTVSTPTVGSSLVVVIDDATGAVLAVRREGTR